MHGQRALDAAPAPRGERPEEGRRLTPDAPHNSGRPPPPRQKRALAARPTNGRPLEGEHLTPPRASERRAEPGAQRLAPARGADVQAPPPTPHHAHGMCNEAGRYRHGTATGGPHPIPCSQAQQHNNGGAHGPTPSAPPISDAGRGARGLQAAGSPRRPRGPPPEDADANSNLQMLPEAPAGSAPAGPTLPGGSVPAPCPAWKRGHCIGEGWCPRQHPRPAADDGGLPAVGHAAARAALRYGVEQGWILYETTRGSVNIQEAVDRVTHTGQRRWPSTHEAPTADRRRGPSWSPWGWC